LRNLHRAGLLGVTFIAEALSGWGFLRGDFPPPHQPEPLLATCPTGHTPVSPATLLPVQGTWTGAASDLLTDDNTTYIIGTTAGGFPTPLEMRVDSTPTSPVPTSDITVFIDFRTEHQCGTVQLSLFNWVTGAFDVIDIFQIAPSRTTDTTHMVVVTTHPDQYVSQTGVIRFRYLQVQAPFSCTTFVGIRTLIDEIRFCVL